MKYYYSVLLSVLILLCISCNSSNESKYMRQPFLVYTYDGDKEIVLYENPNIATVDGASGRWVAISDFIGHAGGITTYTFYTVSYGDEKLTIDLDRSMYKEGDVDIRAAVDNRENVYGWKKCKLKLFP